MAQQGGAIRKGTVYRTLNRHLSHWRTILPPAGADHNREGAVAGLRRRRAGTLGVDGDEQIDLTSNGLTAPGAGKRTRG